MNQLVLETLWFFLPALTANMAPIFATRYNIAKRLDIPLDNGIIWGGKPLLGRNKTVRGLVAGAVTGAITGYIQYLLYFTQAVKDVSLISYEHATFAMLFGAWIGFAGLIGDAVKSFFKRRLNIASGKSWIPFDQIDLVLGVFCATFYLHVLTFAHVAIAIVVIGFGMFVVSAFGVALKIKKSL